MDKAKDGHEEDREVPSEEKENSPFERKEEEHWNNRDEEINYEDIEFSDTMLSFRGGSGFYGDPYFDSNIEGEVLLGVTAGDKSLRFYLFGGVKVLKSQSDDPVALSIKEDVLQLNGGLEFRYYPIPELKVFSPYLLARGGGFLLFWSFKNSLISGSDVISSDSVGGLLLGTGVGVDLIQGKTFSLGAQVIPELYLFGEETSEGFNNDFFDSYGTVRFTVEAGFNF